MVFLPLAFGMNRGNLFFMQRSIRREAPLFYRATGGILFASEVKALLAHPMIEAAINMEGLASMMAVGPSRAP